MINPLEMTKKQTLILSAITVALGIGLIVALGLYTSAQGNTAKQSFGSQAENSQAVEIEQPVKETETKPDGTVVETGGTQTVISKQPLKATTQPQAAPNTPMQATPKQDPVTATQPNPCDYEGCRPPIDVATLTPRICYIGIAAQDIELRTACGKGLGIWVSMNQAIEWLNTNGWQ